MYQMNLPSGHRAGRAGQGFTLVELLVVIGIIALLISILLPVVNRARASAQKTKCMSNMRQWGMAYQLYANENNGWMPNDGLDGDVSSQPIGQWDGRFDPAMARQRPPLWFNALPPMIGSRPYHELQDDMAATGLRLPIEGMNSIFVCPSTSQGVGAMGDTLQDGYFLLYGSEGASVTQRPTFFCYVPNSKFNSGAPDELVKLTNLKSASEAILMTEKRMQPGEGDPENPYKTKTLGYAKSDFKRFAGRHDQGGFLLFVDGHVAQFTMREVTTPIDEGGGQFNMNRPGLYWSVFERIAP